MCEECSRESSGDSRALDDARCVELVGRAVEGDEAARQELLGLLWPHWERLVRSARAMRALRADEDHVASAVAHVASRLARRDWRALGRFSAWQQRHPERTFGDWMRIATVNAVRDYARSVRGGSTRERPAAGPSPKRLLNELALCMPVDQLGARPPVTEQQTALQLLAFAEQHLKSQQLTVLRHWLGGQSAEELAADLGLDPAEAQRLVRSAIATLRRKFSRPEGAGHGSSSRSRSAHAGDTI